MQTVEVVDGYIGDRLGFGQPDIDGKTPPAVQKKLHDAVNQVLAMPNTQQILQAIGAEITPMSQEQFIAFDKAENARYAAVIKKNHITIE